MPYILCLAISTLVLIYLHGYRFDKLSVLPHGSSVTWKLTQTQVDSDFRQQLADGAGEVRFFFYLKTVHFISERPLNHHPSISPFCFSPGVSLTLRPEPVAVVGHFI
jgi:hypothetical protein